MFILTNLTCFPLLSVAELFEKESLAKLLWFLRRFKGDWGELNAQDSFNVSFVSHRLLFCTLFLFRPPCFPPLTSSALPVTSFPLSSIFSNDFRFRVPLRRVFLLPPRVPEDVVAISSFFVLKSRRCRMSQHYGMMLTSFASQNQTRTLQIL